MKDREKEARADPRPDAGREVADGGRSAPDVAVDFADVSFSYDAREILSGCSFHVHAGEFAALLGPNGAGKTTALRLLLGLAEPSSGKVRIFGRPPRRAARLMGYVPQSDVYDPAFPVSAGQVVLMGRLPGSIGRYRREDREAAARAMEELDVADLAGKRYSSLSGGQRRRVLVARALASDPALLVLDEPSSNLDARSAELLYRCLGARKGRVTTLVVTHDTGFVSSLVDSILCMGVDGERRGVVARHAAEPVPRRDAPVTLGGDALRVLHDTELPDACRACEEER